MLIRLLGFTCSVDVMIIVIPFPQWGKSINRNGSRYGCLDGLRGDYHPPLNHLRDRNDDSASAILRFALSSASYRADFLKLRFPKISAG
ncbi:hypothetical protein [Escherichia coli]|uniref:hypothetical protein n=1 Tax=Escherichia coli TaxID=562 RepID=UPI00201D1201|nr:hypothetical protein [Escherichia coli]